MLVYNIEDEEGKPSKQQWQEFSLPLQVHIVEEWCGLKNIWFHQVIEPLQKDFELKKIYKIDSKKLTCNELENGKCYLVCGYDSKQISEEHHKSGALKLVLFVLDFLTNTVWYFIYKFIKWFW